MLTLSACVPCRNNSATLERVIQSIKDQAHPVERVMVGDDNSSDNSPAIAAQCGAEILAVPSLNRSAAGRGKVRAQLAKSCSTELQLSCDATNRLERRFTEYALPWFEDEQVAAVFGRIVDERPQGVAGRWRARHLLLQNEPKQAHANATLCTWAYVHRLEHTRSVGGFDERLTRNEDYDLGKRLLSAGFKVVFEPKCIAIPLIQNSVMQCLERHWRWYVSRDGMSLRGFRQWLGIAWKYMMAKDLLERDVTAASITALVPFHHALMSFRHGNLKRLS